MLGLLVVSVAFLYTSCQDELEITEEDLITEEVTPT